MSRWVDRPHIRAEDYGLPLRCPKPGCGYGWLKVPGKKAPERCPNDGTLLERIERKTSAR